MLNEYPIITPQEFKGIYNVSDAFYSSKEFDAFVLDAQRLDIAPAIGAGLMLDAAEVNNLRPEAPTQEQQYLIDLLHGVRYNNGTCDAVHYGLKRAVAYFALSRFYEVSGMKATPAGVRQAVTEFSEKVNTVNEKREAERLKNLGSKYLELTLHYLCANAELFPTFKPKEAYQKQTAGGRAYSSGGRSKAPNYKDNFRYDYD